MSLKVLLADDSMTAQNMGKKILAESGYDVTTVSNGAAAVKKIAEVKPDVVILDIYMPGYTGLEVCERVRANMDTANLPVLLTVGKMEPYRAEDGAKVRADGVIVKPFEATDLLAVVKKMAEKATPATRHIVSEPEPEPIEEVGQPEPAMPASVDVPSEMAAAPALAMEEFNATPADVPEFKPTIEWTAAPELSVEQPSAAITPEPQGSEIPWSFDQGESQDESAPVTEAAPTEGVEFTSAPQAGYVDVQQAEGLEAGFEAPPTGNVNITTDPALTSPQEITEFVTSFSQANPESTASDEVIAELPTIEPPAESSWDGWAHAEPASDAALETSAEPAGAVEEESHVGEETKPESKPLIDDFEAKVAAAMAGFGVEHEIEHNVEPTVEHHEAASAESLAGPNVDDFEARVAAAMSGFATEPIAETHEASKEVHAQPAEIEAVADDFQARVAAAMSGFTTEPVEPEPAIETHAEPMAEVHPEPAVEETKVDATSDLPISHDDFDARLAQALSAFDPAQPEPQPDMQTASVQLDETTVLPQEAALSLEEEMKQALAHHAHEVAEHPAPAPNPIAEFASPSELEPGPVSAQAMPHSTDLESLAEFGSTHAAQDSGPPHLPEVAAAAFAAAVAPVEAAKPESDKFAGAVQRAIERLKPQLIAEIVKELKGE